MQIPTKNIQYNSESSTFITEISDLGSDFHFEQTDIGVGITLVSHKTSTPVDFYITNVEMDNDNDIICWVLKPDVEQYRALSLVIYND